MIHDILLYSIAVQDSTWCGDDVLIDAIPRSSTIFHIQERFKTAPDAVIWCANPCYSTIIHDVPSDSIAFQDCPRCDDMMCYSTLFHDNPRYPIIFNSISRLPLMRWYDVIIHAVPRWSTIFYYIQLRFKTVPDAVMWCAHPRYSTIIHDILLYSIAFQGSPWCGDMMC